MIQRSCIKISRLNSKRVAFVRISHFSHMEKFHDSYKCDIH